ncbi:hypothetical protein Pmar_PMAR001865 [Perkinsus marinus ATCC 50983]|uniref:Pseudouridine synthase RsuA/RluA-like domain-containing protein n=1 Tax=Perkinsus marinus (strain ATCC 50983 / TXsc) TaxID=423536 RepID=C5LFX6_PERM5|nr:hypothetical protein Pmar_PMAR001865 [Perkinsus marinus ATCC 50983]EER04357.1 hypothetical protein Pmar_PMAR001865 [Perkinsus marinus ATCC 50983]|eukprot:XP_002772541.1 hypothetical protein Pmar_PMAR001865 [Perkinsus marinus ATCC 50983]
MLSSLGRWQLSRPVRLPKHTSLLPRVVFNTWEHRYCVVYKPYGWSMRNDGTALGRPSLETTFTPFLPGNSSPEIHSGQNEELDRMKQDLPLPDEIDQPRDRLRDGKLHFPINVEVGVAGLCVVCTDKSISRQFKTHYREHALRQTFRLLARPALSPHSTDFFSPDGRLLEYGVVESCMSWSKDDQRWQPVECSSNDSTVGTEFRLVEAGVGDLCMYEVMTTPSKPGYITAHFAEGGLDIVENSDGLPYMQLSRLEFPDPLNPTGKSIIINVEPEQEMVAALHGQILSA